MSAIYVFFLCLLCVMVLASVNIRQQHKSTYVSRRNKKELFLMLILRKKIIFK